MMKNLLLLCVSVVFLLTSATVFGQNLKPDQSQDVDTRIDNMGYWMEKAEQGLVPYNPPVPFRPAEYKGSEIIINGVTVTDSPDVPVSTATNITQSENSVFVDPNDYMYVLNSNNSTSWTGSTIGTLYGANYFQTDNGAASFFGSAAGAGGNNYGDPTTAINDAGRQYVGYITLSGGMGVSYSDNGSSWTAVSTYSGSSEDKNHMWIDNVTTSPYQNYLYNAWVSFGGSYYGEIIFQRSTNNGVSWSSVQNISSAINAGSHNQGVNIQTGPGGEVYAAWAVYDSWPSDETAIGFAKSTNGGSSFTSASRIITNIRGIRSTEVPQNMRVNSFPVMAVDRGTGAYSGNIYIVWTNIGTPGVNSGTAGVYMIRSTNGGSFWSSPIKVNQGTGTSYLPWITCDPSTGILAVVYYDNRNVSTTQAEAWVSYSTDAGNTWTDFRVSDVAFTPTPISGLAASYMGDYLGITSLDGRFYPCWTDNRGSTYMTYVSPFEIGLNADFSGSPTAVCSGGTVNFTDASSGSPASYSWSFPGGTPASSTAQNPSVVYNTPGTYNVTLTVYDGIGGSDTETKTGYITVNNVIADFSGTPTNITEGGTVTFTDASSCSPASWSWSFPGGTPNTATGAGPHIITYSTAGTYDVSLTVTKGADNHTETKTNYITVIPPEFNMQNGTFTTCVGNFYDAGGPGSNYTNYEDYTLTFYPSTAGAMIEVDFSVFDVEYQSSCSYDYLRIYDGENASATLIGTYCGTNSPGTVLASNAAGALTFVWHSDVSVTDIGWEASISCVYSGPANDDCANAEAINEVTDYPFDTSTATASGENPGCGGSTDPVDLWYAYTATVTGLATFDLCGSAFDTRLALWDVCGGTTLACNDDNGPACSGLQSSFEYFVFSGSTYYVQVGGYQANAGVGDLTIQVVPAIAGLWTGAVSTDWNTAGNWDDMTVPVSTTDVTIPASPVRWPTRIGDLTMGTECNSVTMEGSSELTVTGDLVIPYGYSFTCNVSPFVYIGGDLSAEGTFTLGTGHTTFYGNSDAVISAGLGSIPSSLSTTYAGGNSQDGNMFDIVTSGTPINVTGFDCNVNGTSAVTIEVWYRTDTYAGHSGSAGWIFEGSYTTTGAGIGNPTHIDIGGFSIPAGSTYGIYLTTTGDPNFSYTNGSNTYSDGTITINAGYGNRYQFSNFYDPRTWNGEVYYTTTGGVTSVDFYDLTIDKSSNNMVSADANINIGNDLTVTAGSWLTNNAGNTATVAGDIYLLGTETAQSSYLDNGTTNVGGECYMQKYYTDNRWHNVSSPVSDAVSGMYLDMYLYSWDETNNWWFNIVPVDVPLGPGVGYLVWSTIGNPTVSFTGGTFNTGDYSPVLTYTDRNTNSIVDPDEGWNMVGNAYPSAIDIMATGYTWTSLLNTIYMYDGTQYVLFNRSTGVGSTGVTRYVPPMQGFFVKVSATSPAAALTIPNDARLHNGQLNYKSDEIRDEIRLEIAGNGYQDEMIMLTIPGATEAFDEAYDAYKLFGVDEAPQLYTTSGEEEMAMNTFNAFTDETIIPVNVKVAEAGMYTLNFSMIDLQEEGAVVYLEDLSSHDIYEVSLNESYSFELNPQEDTHRFNIHFAAPTGMDEIISSAMHVYAYENTVFFEKDFQGDVEVKIYNMLGEKIMSDNFADMQYQMKISEASGYYLVKVSSEDKIITRKIFIK